MIIKLVKGLTVYKDRSWASENPLGKSVVGEWARCEKSFMDGIGSLTLRTDMNDACLLTGEYKGCWVCVQKDDYSVISPLEQLAMTAD